MYIMPWTQPIDPCHNLLASAGVAAIPVLVIFWALVIRKLKGYQASLLATGVALLIAIAIYRMPLKLALLSTFNGVIFGLFPMCWIIFNGILVFNIANRSGQFEVIRSFIATVSMDRRLQALLIAFSFGSFLEGMTGFGVPVAITAAMLTGLGFSPLYAAGLCLIANTVPVAFGTIGIPITVASQITSLPEQAISQMVGRTLPFLSALLPFYLVTIMAGFQRAKEIAPAALVSGITFAAIQFLSSNYLGPALPDVLAGIGSIISLLILLRCWKPRTIWRFPGESAPLPTAAPPTASGNLLWALGPFITLTALIITWGLPPVKAWLTTTGTIQFPIPGLHNAIRESDGNLLPHLYNLNYLSAAGTAIFIAALISLFFSGLTPRQGAAVFASTIRQLRFPILTITAILALAYLVNDAGITRTIARCLAGTGPLFPFFAPVLGWLGVFITGSDTSSNALFGKLQSVTATSIGVDPVVTVGANVSGGVIGKMISPHSIAVAAAAGNLVGKEANLFRFTVRHSFILLFIICCIVLAQAYLLKWMIPVYIHHL
jgi:lactate permease